MPDAAPSTSAPPPSAGAPSPSATSSPALLTPVGPSRLRLWLALVAAGLLGFALATPYFFQVFQALAAKAGKPLPPTPVLFAVEGLKLLVLCGVAAWAGLVCAPRVGFDVPLLRAGLLGQAVGRRLLALVPRALGWGTVATLVVLGMNLVASPLLPEVMKLRAPDLSGQSRLLATLVGASSAFYGGLVEELLVRWALLPAFMLLALQLSAKSGPAFWVGNVFAALLFGAGHLPLALQLGASGWVILYVVVANAIPGLLFGVLFKRHGLEQAILAHAWADVCLHALPILVL